MGLGDAEGVLPDCFEFNWAAFDKVNHTGGAVGFHGPGAVDLLVDKVSRDVMAEALGDGDDFFHEGADAGFELAFVEKLTGVDAAFGDGETVEGDVPDELHPLRLFKAGYGFRFKLGVLEGFGDFREAGGNSSGGGVGVVAEAEEA